MDRTTLIVGAVVVAGSFAAVKLVPDSTWAWVGGAGGEGGTGHYEETPGAPRVPECRGYDALVPCAAAQGFPCEGDGATVPLAVLAPTGLHADALAAGTPPLLGLYGAGEPIAMGECGAEEDPAAFKVTIRDPAHAWPGCLAGEVRWTAPAPIVGPDNQPIPAQAPFTWETREVEEGISVPGPAVLVQGPDGMTIDVPGPAAVVYRTVTRDVPVYQPSGAAFVGRCCVPGCECAPDFVGRCIHVPPAPRVGHERGWECGPVPDAPGCVKSPEP
jgi:hypothetical protein